MARSTNHERARSTHVNDIVGTEFSREEAWPKPSVSTNIDPPEEYDESHTGDYEERNRSAPCRLRVLIRNTYNQAGDYIFGSPDKHGATLLAECSDRRSPPTSGPSGRNRSFHAIDGNGCNCLN
jgi:hypothetical protein